MDSNSLIIKGGECGDIMRGIDWSQTVLGDVSQWPPALLANVNMMLNSPLAYVLICGEDGQLIYNDHYAKFALDKHPEIMGMNYAKAWPEIADYNADVTQRVYNGETIHYKDQLLKLRRSLKAKRTEDVYIDLTYGPIFDNEKICAVIVTVIENADKSELGESRKETARVSAERDLLVKVNAVKDDFISVASHELRTPATGVKQYLGMVLQGYAGELTGVQKDYLHKANISNERQLKTIDDLLKVARVDSNKFVVEKRHADLRSMLKKIVAYHKPRFATSDQTIKLILPVDPVKTMIDPDNITIAIDNLIDNARKYSPAGSHTTVTLSVRKHIEIAIADSGVGVDIADMTKLFTKFQRIDNDRSVEVGGTGLGLYWSQQVVELHDGKITAEQNAPQGMIFTIQLPSA